MGIMIFLHMYGFLLKLRFSGEEEELFPNANYSTVQWISLVRII
jgi:hypothetical protein